MPLNPFFLQGSKGEQGLIQDLINEQIKMFGVDVHYIPRKYLTVNTVIEEVIESKYDSAFPIEAYIQSYDGYGGQGTLLSKFGIQEIDDLTLIISKETFELYLTPLMKNLDGIELSNRPKEGDLIYFPLGEKIFEIKYVEHESPFYQLQENYVYELRCELYRYGNEVIDTSIDEIDSQVEDEGIITSLEFVSIGRTAIAFPALNQNYISKIYLNNDGSGYKSPPSVIIDPPPGNGINAQAVAITTTIGDVTSVSDVLILNAGSGYTYPPKIVFSGGGGSGAAATASVSGIATGITNFNIVDFGSEYTQIPKVTISDPNDVNILPGSGVTALANASISNGKVVSINIINSGFGYTTGFISTDGLINTRPKVTIEAPTYAGFGTFMFNELVVGQTSGIKAKVKSWDSVEKILKVSSVSSNKANVSFYPGEIVVGSSSSAYYKVKEYDSENIGDSYADNEIIEIEADKILDFSEDNPFGNY